MAKKRIKKTVDTAVTLPAVKNDRTWLVIIGCIGLVLALFAGKAYNVDDPLFMWVAQHIQTNPFDFYGFSVNWYGKTDPISLITKNPPFASYYAALIMSVFGENSVVMHLAFLVPALLVMAGTYRLAKRWCSQPILAILVSAITPVFMVSATTVMCDMIMVCFFVWALEFWIWGMETKKQWMLLLAALFICLSALSKYFGVSVLPLILVYTLSIKKRPGWWIVYLVGVCAVLWGYNILTAKMYGHGLLTDAVSYTQNIDPILKGSLWTKGIVALVFTGGCFLSVLLYMPLILSRLWMIIGTAIMVAGVAIMNIHGLWGSLAPLYPQSTGFELFQGGTCVAGACLCIGVTLFDVYKRHDSASIVLLLWVFGTLAFTGFFNWTVNARSILPMAPALGIIIARGIGDKAHKKLLRWQWAALIPAALLSLLVTYADYTWANSQRDMANRILRDYGNINRSIWFEGHWGFQYYMQKNGFKPMELTRSDLVKSGDIIVLAYSNTNVYPIPEAYAHQVDVFRLPVCPFLSVMNIFSHAGFYSNGWGPLPYTFGKVPMETYTFNIVK